MARDQRTRLNAELAHQYSGQRKKAGPATPGRNALTGELTEGVEGELDENVEGEGDVEAAAPAVENAPPKKSLFELPRKEPSRQPLLGSTETPAAPAPAAGPNKPTRRG